MDRRRRDRSGTIEIGHPTGSVADDRRLRARIPNGDNAREEFFDGRAQLDIENPPYDLSAPHLEQFRWSELDLSPLRIE
jgi:hypothetical protein